MGNATLLDLGNLPFRRDILEPKRGQKGWRQRFRPIRQAIEDGDGFCPGDVCFGLEGAVQITVDDAGSGQHVDVLIIPNVVRIFHVRKRDCGLRG